MIYHFRLIDTDGNIEARKRGRRHQHIKAVFVIKANKNANKNTYLVMPMYSSGLRVWPMGTSLPVGEIMSILVTCIHHRRTHEIPTPSISITQRVVR